MTDGLLRCSAGGTEFAIRASDVRHVARADQLRADEKRDGRAGVIKLGGYLVPVFALHTRLGLPRTVETPEPEQHIAVTGDQEQLVGWLVDRITRDATADAMQIAPLPASIGGDARRWFEGIVVSPDRSVLLVNTRQLNPLAADAAANMTWAPPFVQLPISDDSRAEPVALLFSTTALPAADTNRYALSARQVAAIIQPTEMIRVPGCAAHVAGVTLWRDVVVPVVDFRRQLQESAANTRRLIARCGADGRQSLVAFSIDAEIVMHKPAAGDRLLPEASCPPFATGVFNIDGDRVALLDLDALVAS
jgi:chemotaxis signal transduction protein